MNAGTTFTVCDDCWDKPQSEPPIDWERMLGRIDREFGEAYSKPIAALKAERDALKAEVAEKHTMLLNSAGHVNRLDRENAALKVRVGELEEMIAAVQHAAGNCICVLCVESRAIRARKEQEASNAR